MSPFFYDRLSIENDGKFSDDCIFITDLVLRLIFFFKKNGPIPASFCFYFRSFLVTISIQTEKSIDGVLGIQTRGRRMVGADETTELWRPLRLIFTNFTSLKPLGRLTFQLSKIFNKVKTLCHESLIYFLYNLTIQLVAALIYQQRLSPHAAGEVIF